MTRLALTLLGTFAAALHPGSSITVPGRKSQGLLAYLALHAGHPQPRDKVMALLWGDTSDRQARLSLRQTVFRIRRALGAAAPALVMDGDALGLDPAAIRVDARELERLAGLGTLAGLTEAASLYQGDLLEGLVVDERPYEDWLRSERQRLHELAIEVAARILRHEMAAGRDEQAVQSALRLLALDPLQEPVHRSLMRLYERQGRSAAALRQYQECVDALQRELGVEPEPETRRLWTEILQRHPIAAAPVAARLTDSVPGLPAASARPGGGGTAPLIGRSAALDQILAALPGAGSDSGQLILITGEAGIGKTRVVEALAATIVRNGYQVVIAGCHQTEQVLPFRPLVDALRAACVAGRRDLVDALAPALRAEVSRLLPELAEPGAALPAEVQSPGRMFEAMAGLLGALAACQPLVLVIEDLHWADDETLRLLAYLGRRLVRLPLVLIGTSRDEEIEDVPTLRLLLDEVEREGWGVRVVLYPLTRAETGALVRALAPGRPKARSVGRAVSDAWTVSRGNPFVILESVRALQGRRRAARSSEPLLPERVRELTASRLARLSETARHLVAVAAVAGEPVSFGFLADAAALEERKAADVVEELVRRRIFEIAGARLDFTHERIRRVAYERLLPALRVSLHEAVARVLEASNADRLEEVCDRLAHHYGMARNAERAIRYLVLFAQAARTRHALDEALGALEQAASHVGALPPPSQERTAVEIVLEKAFVLSLMARFRDIVALLGSRQDSVDALGDSPPAGRFYFRLGLTQFYLGDLVASERAAQQALTCGRRSGDRLITGLAHYVLSIKGAATSPEAGIEHGRQAIENLSAAHAPFWYGFSHYGLGANLLLTGNLDGARDALTKAVEIGRTIHDLRLQSLGLGSLAVAECLLGAGDRARTIADQAVSIAPDALARAITRTRRAWVALEQGDHQTARVDLEWALEEAERRGIRVGIARIMALLADARHLSGDRHAGRQTATEAIAYSARLGALWDEAWAHRVLARIAHAEGDSVGADAEFRRALAVFAAAGSPFEIARTQLGLAEVVLARGDVAETERLLAEASASFRLLCVPEWLERAQAVARRLALGPGESASRTA